MKQLATISTTIALLLANAWAGQPKTYIYKGKVSGVVCAACSSTVKEALMKLPGVKAVRITLGKEGGLPQINIVSTSAALSREVAIKALGDAADHYHIESLEQIQDQ
jgi:copper chaperone CopZ